MIPAHTFRTDLGDQPNHPECHPDLTRHGESNQDLVAFGNEGCMWNDRYRVLTRSYAVRRGEQHQDDIRYVSVGYTINRVVNSTLTSINLK